MSVRLNAPLSDLHLNCKFEHSLSPMSSSLSFKGFSAGPKMAIDKNDLKVQVTASRGVDLPIPGTGGFVQGYAQPGTSAGSGIDGVEVTVEVGLKVGLSVGPISFTLAKIGISTQGPVIQALGYQGTLRCEESKHDGLSDLLTRDYREIPIHDFDRSEKYNRTA